MGNSPSKNDPLPNKSTSSSSTTITGGDLDSDETAPALSHENLSRVSPSILKSKGKHANSINKQANNNGSYNGNNRYRASNNDGYSNSGDGNKSFRDGVLSSVGRLNVQPSLAGSSSDGTINETTEGKLNSSGIPIQSNRGNNQESEKSSPEYGSDKTTRSKRRNSRKNSTQDLDLDLEIGASMAQLLKTNTLNYSSSVDSDSSSNPGSSHLLDEESSCSSFGNSPANCKFYFKDNEKVKSKDVEKEKSKSKDLTGADSYMNKMDSIAEITIETTSKSKSKSKKDSSKNSNSILSKTTSASSVSSSPPLVPVSNRKLEIDIDSIIEKLILIGTKKPPSQSQMRRGKDKLPLTYTELKFILGKSRQIFLDQPTLLQLSPPVKIVGDIHGQFHDLIRIFNSCGFPPYTNYLFLGDYVDRGYKSLETILLLLCYKIKYPENFFMLRGNHESANITKIYGFYDECKRRLPAITGSHKLWKNFIDVFNTLPIGATINNKILCIHGGLSPDLHDLKQIEQIKRPTDIPDKGLLADLLWSDPDPSIKNFSITNWPKNDRGVSYCFGRKHVDYFCQKFKLDLIVRGHMVVEDGYEFFNKRKLVTVFSAPNYCGEFNNFGAVMSVDKDLYCSFDLIKPQ